ncbi:hypothetical protein [Neobacillus drentensis]|uniref:hypothetical protein n=1 Tax=Neobacillus drentensis TaxID=220684 RepID=UPI002FFEFC60
MSTEEGSVLVKSTYINGVGGILRKFGGINTGVSGIKSKFSGIHAGVGGKPAPFGGINFLTFRLIRKNRLAIAIENK